jgi:hypothetical protein
MSCRNSACIDLWDATEQRTQSQAPPSWSGTCCWLAADSGRRAVGLPGTDDCSVDAPLAAARKSSRPSQLSASSGSQSAMSSAAALAASWFGCASAELSTAEAGCCCCVSGCCMHRSASVSCTERRSCSSSGGTLSVSVTCEPHQIVAVYGATVCDMLHKPRPAVSGTRASRCSVSFGASYRVTSFGLQERA